MSEDMKPERGSIEKIPFTQTFLGATLVLIVGGALGGVALWLITGQYKQASESTSSEMRAVEENGVIQVQSGTPAAAPSTGESQGASQQTDWQLRQQVQDSLREGAASESSPEPPSNSNDNSQNVDSPQAPVVDSSIATDPTPARGTDVFVFYTSRNEEAAFRLEKLLVGAGLVVEVEQEISRRVGFNRLVYAECAAEAAARISALARPEVRLTTVKSVGPCATSLAIFLESADGSEM